MLQIKQYLLCFLNLGQSWARSLGQEVEDLEEFRYVMNPPITFVNNCLTGALERALSQIGPQV
jgi:hypothetical protein